MEINDLKIFYEVARLHSTSKAADQLNYVQSNVSKRVAHLEKQLKRTLFHRTNKGMTLTADGVQFLAHVNCILVEVSKMEAAFSIEKESVHLGSTQTLAKNYLQDYYFTKDFSIFIQSIQELTLKLKEGSLDVMIVNTAVNDSELKELHHWHESIAWTTAIENQETLLNNTILISRDPMCPYRKATLDYLADHQITTEAVIEVDTLDIMLSMLESNKTVALLPQKTIAAHEKLRSLTAPPFSQVSIYAYGLKSATSFDFLKNLHIE
ncbi:LysR family transcriptional regulator [Enterococcus termitis]